MGKEFAIVAVAILVIYIFASCFISGDESRREEE